MANSRSTTVESIYVRIVQLFLASFVLVGFGGPACQPETTECLSVQVTNPEGNYIIPGSQGAIPYRTIDERVLLLDAFVQPGPDIRPAVIIVHGGGWTTGSRVAFVGQFLELLTDAGVNWFSIDYRLAPAFPYPEGLADLEAAIEFIRCNAGPLQIDADRIILLGEDTGAQMAIQAAAKRPSPIRAVISVGGLYDLLNHPKLKTSEGVEKVFGPLDEGTATEQLKSASPLASITGKQPDTLIVHGTADTEVPIEQASSYCQKLLDQGGYCELYSVDGGIHRPENWKPSQWAYKEIIKEFLIQRAGPLPEVRESLNREGSRIQKDLVFARYEDQQGSERELKLDAYLPDSSEPVPAIVLAHGGGWEAGDKVTYLTPLLEPLSKAGFAWFSIDYRLEPDFQNWHQLEDLRRAIRFIRANAQEFNIAPDRIAILGESASGQMVVQVAALPCPAQPDAVDPVDHESCEVQAVVSFYGVYDFQPLVTEVSEGSRGRDLFGLTTLDEPAMALLRQYSPLFSVNPSMPPLLLIHGNNEFLWQQAEALSEKLDQLKVEYRLIELDGAPHGMENWEGRPEWEYYKAELVQWLRDNL